MAKPGLLILLFFAVTMFSCAQGKHGIVSIRAYITERLPGNIPVDAQGEPLRHGPDSIYTVYVETKEMITWDSAWMNGSRYAIEASQLTIFPVDAGTDKSTGQKILLRPADGNQLWLLTLDNVAPGTVPGGEKEKEGLRLRGRKGKKSFTYEVDSLKVLLTTNSV